MPSRRLRALPGRLYSGYNASGLPLGSLKQANNVYQTSPGRYVQRPGIIAAAAVTGPGSEAIVGYLAGANIMFSGAQGEDGGVQAMYNVAGINIENEAFGYTLSAPNTQRLNGSVARPTFVPVGDRAYVNTASAGGGVRHVYDLGGGSTGATRAGMPRGTTPLMSVDSTGAQAYNTPANHVAAYATLFSRKYESHTVLGAPSARAFTYVSYAGARIWTLRVPLHPDVVAGDILEVYRTPYNDNGTTADGALIVRDPGTSLRLAFRYELQASDISNGYVDWDDNVPNAQLGALLYTDANLETDQQENLQPPGSAAMVSYKGMLVQGNLFDKSFIDLELVDAVDLNSDGTFDGGAPKTANLTYVSGSTTVTVNSGLSNLAVGQVLTNSTVGTPTDTHPDFPAGTVVLSINTMASTIVVNNAATASATGNVTFLETFAIQDNTWGLSDFRYALNYVTLLPSVAGAPYSIDVTSGSYTFAQDFAAVYNITRGQDARQLGVPTVTVGAGLVKLEVDAESLDGVIVASSRPAIWRSGVADWSSSGNTTVPFFSGRSRGAITWTKPDQPEHRPNGAAYTQQITSGEILQMVATDDYVYISTDREFIVGVGTFDGFSFRTLSSELSGGWAPSGPKAATVLNNTVYLATTQGVVRVTGSSVAQVDRDLTRVVLIGDPAATVIAPSLVLFANSNFLASGVHYVFCTDTESWSTFSVVSPTNVNLVYSGTGVCTVVGSSDVHYTRWLGLPYDLFSADGLVTVAKVTDTTLTCSSHTLAVGDRLTLSGTPCMVVADDSGTYTVNTPVSADFSGSAAVSWGVPVTLQFQPFATEDVESWKHWSAVTLRLNTAPFPGPLVTTTLAFYSGLALIPASINDVLQTVTPAMRFMVPADAGRSEEMGMLITMFGNQAGLEGLTLEYVAGDGPRRIR